MKDENLPPYKPWEEIIIAIVKCCWQFVYGCLGLFMLLSIFGGLTWMFIQFIKWCWYQ